MRSLILVAMLLLCSIGAQACDVCGCSIGGNYFGILPGFQRHFIGLRWFSESSNTALSSKALQAGDFHSSEQFQSLDLMARFNPSHRWQALLVAPYRNYRQTDSGNSSQSKGLGDVSLMANYILFNTGDSIKYRWRQTLSVGGGIKLPTGQNKIAASDGALLHPNLQPGTGSTDFLLSAAYTLRRKGWGGTADMLLRLNTANKQSYLFGNHLSGSVKLFYWTNLGQVALLPNAGIFMDAAQANRDNNVRIDGSEGISNFATLGLDAYFGHFSAGANFQPPVWQSRTTVQTKARWMFTLNFIF